MKKTYILNSVKRFFISAISSLALICSVAACNNISSAGENPQVTADGKVMVSLDVQDGVSGKRTALPSYEWTDYVYDIKFYEKYEEGKESQLLLNSPYEKVPYSVVQQKVAMLPGKYKFFLNGYKSEGEGYTKVLEASCVIDVTLSTTSIPLRMYASSGLTGNAIVNGLFPENAKITSCKACVKDSLTTALSLSDSSSDLGDISIITDSVNHQKKISYSVNDLSSAQTHFAVIKFYDDNGKVVFDYVESLYIMGGKTSQSTFTFGENDYYLKNVCISLKKDGSTWNDSGIALKLVNDSDGSEYAFETETGSNLYTAAVPEGSYSVILASSGNMDSGTDITANQNVNCDLYFATVNLPVNAGASYESVSGIISADSGNTTLVVLKDREFKVKVNLKPGFETTGDIKIGEKTAVEGVLTLTSSDIKADSTLEGIRAVTYTITYNFAGTDGSWKTGFTPESSYTYDVTSDVNLVSKENVSYINTDKICTGWKIDSVSGGSSTLAGTVSVITAGSTTGNLVLKPVFIDQNKGEYSVKYLFQTVDGAAYENRDGYTEKTLSEVDGTKVTVEAMDAPVGFTKPASQEITVKSSEETVVTFKYDRKTVTLKISPSDNSSLTGYWKDNSQEPITLSGLYGSTVKNCTLYEEPFLTDYSFDAWSPSLPVTFDVADEGKTYYSAYTQVNAKYTVKFYFQNLEDDEYTVDSSKTEENKAKIGQTVTTAADSETGFEEPVITPATVTADGNAEVKVKYDRKYVTVFLDPNGGKWTDNSAVSKQLKGKIGAVIGTLPTIAKEDYSFEGFWNGDKKLSSTDIYPSDSVTYTAKWTQDNAPYEVKYYVENVDGTVEIVSGAPSHTGKASVGTVLSYDTETMKIDGVDLKYAPSDIAGFNIVCAPVTVAAETTVTNNVVSVKYMRKTVKYTFNADGGNWSGSTADVVKEGKYGAAVGTVDSPVRTGFTFTGWIKADDTTSKTGSTAPTVFGASDLSYKAFWYSQISGEGEDTLAKDISINVSGTGTSRTLTVTVPYNGTWTYKWYVDGTLAASTQSFQQVFTRGKHEILVEAVENGLSFTKRMMLNIE